jgi:hypothetical protein
MPVPISEITITRALVALRVRTIREGRAGLDHVEALLTMRGHNLGPVPMPRAANIFRKNDLRRLILAALRERPQTCAEIARHISSQRPDVPYATAYERASSVLSKMGKAGLLENERPVWRVASRPPDASPSFPPAA